MKIWVVGPSDAGSASRDEAAAIAEKFRSLLDALPDAIVLVNAEGRIVSFNEEGERLFGHKRDEVIGRPIEVLVPERFRGGHPEHRDAYRRDPKRRPMGAGLNLAALKSDGTEFPAEISLGQVRMLDQAFTIAAIRDVTERRQTQMALEVAYKELESFSYSIAHDLRAPLRGMNGFAQALIEDYADELDADGLDFLNEIRNNAIRMGELIDALLSLSRVARSRLHVERVDLGALARSVALRCAQSDPTRPVDVVIHDRLFARGDVALLRTLIENLVLNAWKFTRDTANARIEIGSKPQDDGVFFFVRDNGAGFDMAHAAKLFGAFQRLHSEKDFPGTGIGLATAQRIVHRHGGRIWADGARGEGAMFAFTLPADTKEALE